MLRSVVCPHKQAWPPSRAQSPTRKAVGQPCHQCTPPSHLPAANSQYLDIRLVVELSLCFVPWNAVTAAPKLLGCHLPVGSARNRPHVEKHGARSISRPFSAPLEQREGPAQDGRCRQREESDYSRSSVGSRCRRTDRLAVGGDVLLECNCWSFAVAVEKRDALVAPPVLLILRIQVPCAWK